MSLVKKLTFRLYSLSSFCSTFSYHVLVILDLSLSLSFGLSHSGRLCHICFCHHCFPPDHCYYCNFLLLCKNNIYLCIWVNVFSMSTPAITLRLRCIPKVWYVCTYKLKHLTQFYANFPVKSFSSPFYIILPRCIAHYVCEWRRQRDY